MGSSEETPIWARGRPEARCSVSSSTCVLALRRERSTDAARVSAITAYLRRWRRRRDSGGGAGSRAGDPRLDESPSPSTSPRGVDEVPRGQRRHTAMTGGWMRNGKDVPLAQGAKRAPVLSPLQQKCSHVLPTKTSEARAP
eukprot:scaffold23366_cov112-Isochrysis_galbana.AAC.5